MKKFYVCIIYSFGWLTMVQSIYDFDIVRGKVIPNSQVDSTVNTLINSYCK